MTPSGTKEINAEWDLAWIWWYHLLKQNMQEISLPKKFTTATVLQRGIALSNFEQLGPEGQTGYPYVCLLFQLAFSEAFLNKTIKPFSWVGQWEMYGIKLSRIVKGKEYFNKYLGKGGDIFFEKEGYKCNLCKEDWESKTFTKRNSEWYPGSIHTAKKKKLN